jgi:hypothetical protein
MLNFKFFGEKFSSFKSGGGTIFLGGWGVPTPVLPLWPCVCSALSNVEKGTRPKEVSREIEIILA